MDAGWRSGSTLTNLLRAGAEDVVEEEGVDGVAEAEAEAEGGAEVEAEEEEPAMAMMAI